MTQERTTWERIHFTIFRLKIPFSRFPTKRDKTSKQITLCKAKAPGEEL